MPSASSHLLRLFRSAQAVQWDVLPRNQTITDGSGVLDVATYNLTDNSGFQQIPANNGMTLRVGGGSTGAAGTITLSASLLLSGLTSSLPKGGGAYTLTGGGITLSNAESPFVIDADIKLFTVLSGSGGFVKSGVGVLNTNRRHTITGPVVVTGGTFQKTGNIVGSVFGTQTDVTLSDCTFAVSPGSYNVSNQVYKSLTLLGGVTLKSSGDYQSDNGDIGFQNNILMVGSNIIHSTGGAYGKHNWYTGGFTGDSSAVVTLNNGAGFGVYGSMRAIIFSGGSWENYLGTIVNNGDLTIRGTVNLTKATVTLPTTARRIGFHTNNCTARLGEVTGPGVLFDNGKTGCAWILGERNTTFSFVGSITGAVSLTKLGTGVLSLAGSNTLSGVTTVTAGSLSIGEGGTAGDLGTSPVVNNSNLIFNRTDTFTFANAISGTGTLDHSGTGTTTLAGALTYTGTTTVNQGTLVLPSGASAFSHDIVVDALGVLTVPGGTNLTGTHSGSGTINALPGHLKYNGVDVQAPIFVRPVAFTGTYLSAAVAAPVVTSPANGASTSIANHQPTQNLSIIANDTGNSPENYTPLTYSVLSVTAGNTATFSGSTLQFSPGSSFSGAATISYSVTNSMGVATTRSFTYNVAANSAPVISNSGTTQSATAGTLTTFNVAATDADGDTMTYTITSGPSHGMASFTGNALSYTATSGYEGSDAIGFDVSDGHGGVTSGTVNWTVTSNLKFIGNVISGTKPTLSEASVYFPGVAGLAVQDTGTYPTGVAVYALPSQSLDSTPVTVPSGTSVQYFESGAGGTGVNVSSAVISIDAGASVTLSQFSAGSSVTVTGAGLIQFYATYGAFPNVNVAGGTAYVVGNFNHFGPEVSLPPTMTRYNCSSAAHPEALPVTFLSAPDWSTVTTVGVGMSPSEAATYASGEVLPVLVWSGTATGSPNVVAWHGTGGSDTSIVSSGFNVSYNAAGSLSLIKI